MLPYFVIIGRVAVFFICASISLPLSLKAKMCRYFGSFGISLVIPRYARKIIRLIRECVYLFVLMLSYNSSSVNESATARTILFSSPSPTSSICKKSSAVIVRSLYKIAFSQLFIDEISSAFRCFLISLAEYSSSSVS